MNLRAAILGAGLMAGLAAAPAAAQGLRWTATDSNTWAGISGQMRVRAESWTNFGAGAPAGADLDDAFGLSRLLVRGELHGRRVTAVLEVKSSLAASRSLPGGSRTADEDQLDLQQLYAELRPARQASFRAGRFDLALGRERLVSPLDWTNSRRVFQGAEIRVTRGAELRAFWVRPVMVRQRRPNLPDTLRVLYGAQVSRVAAGTRVEAYWLRSTTDAAAFNGTGGAERRHTLGARLARSAAPRHVDLDAEAAWQTGTVGAARARAWMIGVQAGWSAGAASAPRLYAGVDAASGDRAAGGGVQTFNQLYPLSHAYLGYADVHGRQNVVAAQVGVSWRSVAGIVVQVDAHDFSRASAADGLYGADGSLSRPAGTGLPRHIGSELDLTLRRAGLAQGRLALLAGASVYRAGAFLKASGTGENITWAYTQVTVTW